MRPVGPEHALGYLLRHLGFDGRQAVTPQAQQIVLKNEEELVLHLE